MRKFLFWNEAGEEKETEQLSLKKAIMSVQGNFKDKMISVEYISKKGKEMCHSIVIPIGRKLRQSIFQQNTFYDVKKYRKNRTNYWTCSRC